MGLNNMTESVLQGSQGQQLALRKISTLSTELKEWRSNHEIRRAYREGGGVFDFVKGLRLAARLIYILKNKLAEYKLDANWGQILDDNGVYLSPECDIIIHRGQHIDQWDGEGGNIPNVMDFRFIELKKVLAVISCKSYFTGISQEDRNYCKRLKPYLKGKKFWLFAECIPKGKEKAIDEKVRSIGHNKLWYLYTWDDDNLDPEEDRKLWEKFFDEIDRIGKKELMRSKKR